MMVQLILRRFCLAVFCLGVFGCAVVQQSIDTLESVDALKRCRYEILDIAPRVTVTGFLITAEGIKKPEISIALDAKIGVKNTTRKDIQFNRMTLDLYVDGEPFAAVDSANKVSIRSGDQKAIHALFEVVPENVTRKIAEKIQGAKVSYKIYGTFYFDVRGIQVPVSVQMIEGQG